MSLPFVFEILLMVGTLCVGDLPQFDKEFSLVLEVKYIKNNFLYDFLYSKEFCDYLTSLCTDSPISTSRGPLQMEKKKVE